MLDFQVSTIVFTVINLLVLYFILRKLLFGRVNAVLADAQNRAQRAYEAKMADAETDAKRLRSEAEAQIASERDAMLRGARNEVASLALLAAAKVAQRPTEDGDRALVDSFLAEVGEQA